MPGLGKGLVYTGSSEQPESSPFTGARTLPASFLFLPHTRPFRHLESGGGKGSVISEQSTWAEAGPRLAPGAQVALVG